MLLKRREAMVVKRNARKKCNISKFKRQTRETNPIEITPWKSPQDTMENHRFPAFKVTSISNTFYRCSV